MCEDPFGATQRWAGGGETGGWEAWEEAGAGGGGQGGRRGLSRNGSRGAGFGRKQIGTAPERWSFSGGQRTGTPEGRAHVPTPDAAECGSFGDWR